MLGLSGFCTYITCRLYFKKLPDKPSESIGIVFILSLIFLFIFEGAYVKILKRFERWDPQHRVFRSIEHPYGKRRFMTEEDETENFELSKNINDFTGKILGIDSRGRMVSKKEYMEYGNEHTIVFGNSGTKKGVAFVIPQCLQIINKGRSAVIVSTKDDNYSILANIARKNGYTVWAFTLRPGETEHSDAIDFTKLIKGRMDIAQTCAQCIIETTSPGERPDYWYRGERHLLFALLIYFSYQEQTLKDLYNFILEGLDHLESVLDLISPNHPAYGSYRIFRGDTSKSRTVKQQVVEGLGVRLASFMADENMQEIVSNDEISFEKMCQKKCLCFVVVSDKTSVYKALSSMFLSLMFFSFGSYAEKFGGSLPSPIEVIIDEAFASGSIPDFASVMATARGNRVHITTILQSLPQLDILYPNISKGIANDCGTKILVHTDDKDTAQYFSDLAGTFTAEQTMKNAQENVHGSRVMPVELLSVSEILGKDIDKQIVHISGATNPTIILDKQPWFSNWPGSKTLFFNKKNGKTYHSHPLLVNYKKIPLNKHTPKWAKEKASRMKQQQERIQNYKFKESVNAKRFEF